MLDINNLHAYYGKSHVLHGVTFQVGAGEIVALLGRNGSGRSTTAKAIMGLVECTGHVSWKGQEILGKKPFEIAHLGIGHVPENRDIFPKITVHQNLMLGQKGKGKGSRWGFDDMYTMFPRLKERQHTEAGVLSGGEQQMLTLCRTLMGDPDLIIIDEPTEGLAPKIVELVGEYLQKLKARGGGGAAHRTEAHHRHEHFRPGAGDGAWQHRVSGHAGKPAGRSLHKKEWLEV
jgi:ABC-type branched-chain amino acid transport systems, ATPase component